MVMQATVQLEGVFSREVTFRSILSNFIGIFFPPYSGEFYGRKTELTVYCTSLSHTALPV